MKRKNLRRSNPSTELLLPQPSPEGVAKIRRALYRRKTGKDISEDEAQDVMYRIMRFQYVNILINTAHGGYDHTGAFADRDGDTLG